MGVSDGIVGLMNKDLDKALEDLPLFPLHEAVLFPGTLLPLHVFEPRYCALVEHVLQTHQSLSIVHVLDPSADMSGNPPIAPVAGVGTIVEHTKLPGGRYSIVLLGRARVRLQELRFRAPYRRALASLLQPENEDAVRAGDLAAMHSAASTFAQLVRGRDAAFSLRVPKSASTGAVADAYAHQLIVSARERQDVLCSIDVPARVRLVTESLTVQRAVLAPQDPSSLN
jgi:Lon protease-like protein